MLYRKRLKDIDALQIELKRRRPLKRHELEDIKKYYRIGLTWSSNALEGNSLTETETKIVFEDGITVGWALPQKRTSSLPGQPSSCPAHPR